MRYGLLILLFVLIGLPVTGDAYHVLNDPDGNGFVFNSWSDIPVSFRIDGGTLNGGDGVSVFLDACEEWNNVSGTATLCGEFTRLEQDITEDNFDSVTSLSDGIVDVVFDETGEILSSLGLPSTTLGVGIIAVNSAGTIVDGILILNGSRPSSSSADIVATAVHEMGHIWGLAHTPIGAISTSGSESSASGLEPVNPSAIPTMFPFTNPVDDSFHRSLEPDDTAGIRLVYPD